MNARSRLRLRKRGAFALALLCTPLVHAGVGTPPSWPETAQFSGEGGDARLSLGECELSADERSFAEALHAAPGQKRRALVCDADLLRFARARARDMVARGYFGHVTPENLGPNDQLRASGYPLPAYYSHARGNNVEALAGGFASAQEALARLLDSRDHRAHLLGESAFYAAQDRFAVAYLRDWRSPHVDHWVIVIARRAAADEPGAWCGPPPGACRLTRNAVVVSPE